MRRPTATGPVRLLAAAGFALCAAAVPAAAQGQGQQGYIQYGQDNGIPNAYAAQLEVRIGQLEETIRNLTGMVEQLQYQNQQLSEQVQRALNDLQFRVQTLEGGAAAPSSAPIEPLPPPDQSAAVAQPQKQSLTAGTEGNLAVLTNPDLPQVQTGQANQPSSLSMPAGDPAAEYNLAYSLLERTDYAGAEQAFQQFLQQHPSDPLASNARYWLGETYYVRGRFQDAAVAFAQSYQQFPQGAKAPDSLLKLGMSLGALGERDDACLSFSQLQREFPSASAPMLRRAQQERDRLQCQ